LKGEIKMTPEQKERIEHLTLMLNNACRRYYIDTDDGPAMSDAMYDKMLAELNQLEQDTGECLPTTPTKRVGFTPPYSELIPHIRPVLSLKNTKDINELLYFIGEHEGVLSWKLDGISIVLEYNDGHLMSALTRGDGFMGRDIFNNIMKIKNVPKQIALRDHLYVRGEGCLSIKEFETINKTISHKVCEELHPSFPPP
jgi:DNA ligase (NAD+)